MASQDFKQEYYKTLKYGNRFFYIYKNLESFNDGKNWKLSWMTAYENMDGKGFIVESGAGISEQKMESQIKSYLDKHYGKRSVFG